MLTCNNLCMKVHWVLQRGDMIMNVNFCGKDTTSSKDPFSAPTNIKYICVCQDLVSFPSIQGQYIELQSNVSNQSTLQCIALQCVSKRFIFRDIGNILTEVTAVTVVTICGNIVEKFNLPLQEFKSTS